MATEFRTCQSQISHERGAAARRGIYQQPDRKSFKLLNLEMANRFREIGFSAFPSQSVNSMTKDDKKLLDDIFLQPWFLPQQTAFAIKRILPPEHRHRMKFYFDDYGCLKCGKTDLQYGSNALCKPVCNRSN